ncbi:MAG: 30S ribosomal protein S5 [Candidatus Pacebacteria bacterium]|jgi:small subunit ribosomal protein S5|nr:30S ribosomal protein S5 [Candidatus Paceibacterota bacterium]|tara:strand:+ start:11977 stop:12537 length:561 start_codon:yes stop_codon:yes gene_type:complete
MEKTTTKKPDRRPNIKKPGGSQGLKKNEKPKKKKRRSFRRPEKVRSEFDQKIISIRRVTRVVAGGRRFSFSVALVSGNRRGSVGVGVGKASDTALAIEKATRNAKKNMIKVSLDKNMRIAHDIDAKYNASRVAIIPSPEKGLVAGSSVRNVLELAGIKDITAKMLSRSKNKLNNARAAVKALTQLT